MRAPKLKTRFSLKVHQQERAHRCFSADLVGGRILQRQPRSFLDFVQRPLEPPALPQRLLAKRLPRRVRNCLQGCMLRANPPGSDTVTQHGGQSRAHNLQAASHTTASGSMRGRVQIPTNEDL